MGNGDTTGVFFGRVHPERADVSISAVPPLTVDHPDGTRSSISLEVAASQISIRVDGELAPDRETEKNVAAQVAQILVDAFGLTTGRGYTVEITGLNRAPGTTIFGCEFSELNARPLPAFIDLGAIARVALGSEGAQGPLRRALGDFRRAILEPDDTPFHCYRAVEALTYFFNQHGGKHGWSGLREALDLDEGWIKSELKEPADPIRHGKVVPVSAADRSRQLSAARKVIGRFVVYTHPDLSKLTADERRAIDPDYAERW